MARSRTAAPKDTSAALGFEAKLWLAAGKGLLENQSRTFASLRDTLLPKLLSGELSVTKHGA